MTAAAQRDDRDWGAGASERTCAGCRVHAAPADLVRLAWVEELVEPTLVPDLGGKLGGRGVWVHARQSCLRTACRSGFARSLRREVRVDPAALGELLVTQIDRGVEGLLIAAIRRRAVALGTDAVADALRAGAASLLLVAKDAAGRRDELIERAREGQVPMAELFDKTKLGRLSGKQTLGVLAVLDSQIAREIATKARWLAGLSEDG